jgi:hypothetical protein
MHAPAVFAAPVAVPMNVTLRGQRAAVRTRNDRFAWTGTAEVAVLRPGDALRIQPALGSQAPW